MSGEQTVCKTMNKGSWRMLQDCKIYATVHILNKAKNHKPKDGSQMGICEGQFNLAGACTRGQKKAQRCFIFFVACICQIQPISERSPEAPLAKESQETRAWLCHTHVLTRSARGTSCLSGYPWGCRCSTLSRHKLHLSRHSVTATENFRPCDGNWLSWLLRFHVSKIPAQNCSVLDPQSQTARDDFHACTCMGKCLYDENQSPWWQILKGLCNEWNA